jgi:DNA helicase HerA-like ATPase
MIGVDPAKLTHTVIVGQSGSGKSFFLGRLIEEILIQTRARVVILDPNADFLNIRYVAKGSVWNWTNEAGYTQDRRVEFERTWKKIPLEVKSTHLHDHQPTRAFEVLRSFDWPRVSSTLVAAVAAPEAGASIKREIETVHRFVRETYARFGRSDYVPTKSDVLEFCEAYAVDAKGWAEELRSCGVYNPRAKEEERTLYERSTSPASREMYFGFARHCCKHDLFDSDLKTMHWTVPATSPRLEVWDSGSVRDPGLRFLALSALIKVEQEVALGGLRKILKGRRRLARGGGRAPVDQRVARFLVVDEAHNVAPKIETSAAQGLLRDQIRTIAAEGRKYGLFLILVSQRPDKLDPLTVSECDNRLLMRVNSSSVLAETKVLLGLGEEADGALDLPIGRGMMFGRWGRGSIQGAARRTVQGGGDLGRWWQMAP